MLIFSKSLISFLLLNKVVYNHLEKLQIMKYTGGQKVGKVVVVNCNSLDSVKQ